MPKAKTGFANKKIISSALVLLAMGLTAYAISIYLNIFVSNYLTPELYGDFTITLRSLGLVSVLLLLGSNQTSVKYLSKFFSNKENENVTCFINWNLKLVLKTFTFCIALCLLMFLVVYILHILKFKDIRNYHHVTYVLWLAPLSAFAILLSSYILSIKKSKLYYVMSQIAQKLFLLVIFCIAIYFFDMKLEYSSIVITIFIALVLIIVIESISLNSILKSYLKERKKISLNSQPEWMFQSLKFTFGTILYSIMCVTDLYIIEIFNKDEVSVGYYSAILVIGSLLIVVIPKATVTIIKPQISTMLSNKKFDQLSKLTNIVIFTNFLSMTPILLVIIFFSRSLLSFFGAGYQAAYIPLIIISVSYYLAGLFQPYSILLFYTNATKGVKVDILQLVLTICLGIPFTYMWGLLGISVSVAIALLAATAMKYLVTNKEIGSISLKINIEPNK